MNDIEFYQKECIRAAETAKRYGVRLAERFYEAERNAVFRETARGGEMLHRGFYCPSQILDIVAGGVQRGKPVPAARLRKSPDYAYGFDTKDRLVTVSRENERELVFYENGVETGLTFAEPGGEGDIRYLSECVYEDGRIMSYAFFILDPMGGPAVYMQKESYTYEEDRVIVEWSVFSNGKMPLLQKERYIFYTRNGRLTEYARMNGEEPVGLRPVRVERYVPRRTDDGPFRKYHRAVKEM